MTDKQPETFDEAARNLQKAVYDLAVSIQDAAKGFEALGRALNSRDPFFDEPDDYPRMRRWQSIIIWIVLALLAWTPIILLLQWIL